MKKHFRTLLAQQILVVVSVLGQWCPALGASVAGAPQRTPSGSSVWPAGVMDISIDVSPSALSSLRRAPREYVAGTVSVGTNVYGEVGLHLKGHGSFRPVDEKPCFTLKFNQNEPEQRFHGLRKVHLNNSIHDPTYLSQYLGSELARRFGLACPRAGHARVRLNGHDLGLYVLVEGVTRDFLDEQFGNHDGVVFEAVHSGATGGLEIDFAGSKADTNAVQALRLALLRNPPAGHWSWLQALLDIEEFTRFMAFEALVWHWDGYYYGHLNYRIYQNPSRGRLVFIPHGMDTLFKPGPLPALHVAKGTVAQAMLDTAEGRLAYARELAALSTNAIWAELPGLIEEREKLIQPILAARGQAKDHAAAMLMLREWIQTRLTGVRSELASVPAAGWTNGAMIVLQDKQSRRPGKTNMVRSPVAGGSLSNLLTTAQKERWKSTATVRELAITIADPAWATAGKEVTNWFLGTVAEGEVIYSQVGVRLQGRTTRRPPSARPNLTLKFNYRVEGQEFHGMSKCHLRNAVRDWSFLKEYVGYSVFGRAGLPAPRVEYANVSINGQPQGLFVLVEGVTTGFLDRTFGNHQGNLYEGDLADLDGALEQDYGDRTAGGQDVAALVEAVRRTNPSNGLAELRPLLNVEQFAKYLAAEMVVVQIDGYCLNANNYRLYRDGADGRFVFLPHGLDALFANPYARLMPAMKGLLAQRFLESEEGKQLYVKALGEVLDQAFRPEQITASVTEACLAIQPVLAHYSSEALAKQKWSAEFLFTLLRERDKNARHQLIELQRAVRPALHAQAKQAQEAN